MKFVAIFAIIMQFMAENTQKLARELEKFDSFGIDYFNTLPIETQEQILEIFSIDDTAKFNQIVTKLYEADFIVRPPTINEFLDDPYYMGVVGADIYPKWREDLEYKIFDPRHNITEVILTGCIGGGKSTVANIIMLYIMTKVFCMRDPIKTLGFMQGSNIFFALFNITLEQAKRVNYKEFQSRMLLSPFIREHLSSKAIESGRISADLPFPTRPISISLGSGASHALGQNTLSAILDEGNFASGKNLDKSAIVQTGQTYNSLKSRIISRYQKKMDVFHHYFIFLLISSKKFLNDFVESHIEEVRNNKEVVILDYAVWDIKPPDTYKNNGKYFRVLVGDKIVKSRILANDEVLSTQETEAKIINVPDDPRLKQSFIDNVDQAIQDHAGISTSYIKKFIAREDLIKEVFDKSTQKNGFIRDTVECSLGSKIQLKEYLNLDELCLKNYAGYFPRYFPAEKRFIHIDLSKNGDKTGFAMGHFAGYKNSHAENVAYPIIRLDLVGQLDYMSSEIDYEKIRNLIYYLNDTLHFRIKDGLITYDSWGASLGEVQMLQKSNYKAEILSVDRTTEGYDAFKSAILYGYMQSPKHGVAYKEAMNLEKTPNGKIDHPVNNLDGTKGCFSGNTRIFLASGDKITFTKAIEELKAGKELYTFCNENGRIVTTKIKKVWESKRVAKLRKVIIDSKHADGNVEVVMATPEHLFLLTNGDYKESQYLYPNDTLEGFYGALGKEYGRIFENSEVCFNDLIPVYDLEVESVYSNFLLAAGVFVHNSKDVTDAIAGVSQSILAEFVPISQSSSVIAATFSRIESFKQITESYMDKLNRNLNASLENEEEE